MSDPSGKLARIGRPWLMLVTEPADDLPGIVAEAVRGGVDLVQWRCKDLPAETTTLSDERHSTYRSLARDVRRAAGEALLIVNGPAWAAEWAKADGCHMPEDNVRMGTGIVGRSVHSSKAAEAAAERGADYLIGGTIFASGSHPGDVPGGPELLGSITRIARLPVVAIGGVAPENVCRCLGAGATGIAVLSRIMRASDPAAAAAAYRKALDTAVLGEPDHATHR